MTLKHAARYDYVCDKITIWSKESMTLQPETEPMQSSGTWGNRNLNSTYLQETIYWPKRHALEAPSDTILLRDWKLYALLPIRAIKPTHAKCECSCDPKDPSLDLYHVLQIHM